MSAIHAELDLAIIAERLQRLSLSSGESQTLWALVGIQCATGGEARASYRELAQRTGLGEQSIATSIRRLEALGIVVSTPHKGRTAKTYRVMFSTTEEPSILPATDTALSILPAIDTALSILPAIDNPLYISPDIDNEPHISEPDAAEAPANGTPNTAQAGSHHNTPTDGTNNATDGDAVNATEGTSPHTPQPSSTVLSTSTSTLDDVTLGVRRGGLGEGKEGSLPPTIEAVVQAATRYTDAEKRRIMAYWDTLKYNRKTGRIAPSVVVREMGYWDKFPVNVVMEALEIHITRYRESKGEDYTRGIIRRVKREHEAGWQQPRAAPKPQAGTGRAKKSADATQAELAALRLTFGQ